MSVSKQSEVVQQPFFYPQRQIVDLTQQERKALSLVWNPNSNDARAASQREDNETSHCAVLGYN
ncbi:MAG: hypothetical protein CML20_04785 [Rheinheimera sp.]|uniref:hypothetical protein n=1 Tax=Arsukibacterium sp. UBA3155 TaxID=1946058 RepID=UPI000C8B3817|nr:hypothetical protein [Arsukibacterium sp. UBA3155]MAD74106.1 hypothetical protein [Rheinheimera sp.]